ncbi:MAG: TonB-dependent receptor [Bacteroidetes bacterium]|nr:TonB-dependent receptor [Bacteroidota bacterium]
MLHSFIAIGQDTIALKEVDVTARRLDLSAIGKKTQAIDSTTKQQFVYNSVGDILNLNTPIFIKNYGPGSLSTSSFRGGNASQTAILWNGFNIQSGMLGQIDLALLPSVLFDKITVEYGGSSSVWGSGAVGGSIHLDNTPRFNRGFTTIANLSAGSFGLFNASTNIEYSDKKFISSTKAYLQNSVNDFRYRDTADPERPAKIQRHATYTFKGLMQEFRYMINNKQIISANIWYNRGARQIPVYNIYNLSRAEQTDANLKSSINWNYTTSGFKSIVRTAFFNDQLNYTDSVFSIDSKSRLQTIIAENENNFKWKEKNELNVGVNFTSYTGRVDNYEGTKTMSKAALFLGNKFSFYKDKLISYVSVRGEYFSTGKMPLTGNVSLEYKLTKNLTSKLNGAKVFRQPTLNELYWRPGGNPNLLPEEGFTYEGDLAFQKTYGKFSVFISGSAYMRTINNWILWVPGPNATTPVNIQQVFSRGTETSSRIGWQKNKLKISMSVISGYVLSTVQSSRQENGNTEARQLIYTPRYTVNGNLSLSYNHATLIYYHQYIGYRFTTSDNLQWLPPYHYSSLRFNYKTSLQTTNMILFVACNNMLNTNYEVIAAHYMPLRNFEIGITLSTNKPNKPKETGKTPE